MLATKVCEMIIFGRTATTEQIVLGMGETAVAIQTLAGMIGVMIANAWTHSMTTASMQL